MTATETQTAWRSRIVDSGAEKPEQLLANPRNWRIHPKAQQDALAGVLSEVGWIQQVVVNRRTGHLIDGHLRVTLAMRQGVESIPVLYVDLDKSEEALALATIDPLSAMAVTDAVQLEALLSDVSTNNLFVQELLDDLGAGIVSSDDDTPILEVPAELDKASELQKKWQTDTGQIWSMKSNRRADAHRLVCGDSTDAAVISLLMQGRQADLIFTDPPYGVGYTGKTKDALTIENDNLGDEATRELVAAGLRNAPLREGGVFYVCSPAGNTETAFRLALIDAGLELRQCLVWVKQQFVMGRQDYHWRHESLLYGWKSGAAHYFIPERIYDTVLGDDLKLQHLGKTELVELVKEYQRRENTTAWNEDRPHSSIFHPTTKPIALVAKAIRNSSRPGDLIYDGFSGGGSTLVAAEQTGRVGYGGDIDPKYVAVTLERMAAMGLKPERID